MLRLAIAVAMAVTAGGAQAGSCLQKVRNLYATSLHAYERPPYRSEKSVYDDDGSLLHVIVSTVESPVRTMSGVPGDAVALVIDRQVWTAPGPNGPWAEAPSNFPPDRRAAFDRAHAQQMANIEDPVCEGLVEMDGATYEKYGFSTRTDPDPEQGGLFFGERSTVYIDPETRLVMRWEQTDFVSSWSADPDPQLHVTTFDYDETIRLEPPQS
ncbi:hypothetical protein [Anianabacter salinae]|uniref:hypothetical protein n=1 Tax=Anianabacter salinae TaxID=2851023 RepID=UPI00225E36D3|nr:hypothetical protein [Anianabacter salinae]MBV0913301.1 hypothetical protein [Anianabacter salinae]